MGATLTALFCSCDGQSGPGEEGDLLVSGGPRSACPAGCDPLRVHGTGAALPLAERHSAIRLVPGDRVHGAPSVTDSPPLNCQISSEEFSFPVTKNRHSIMLWPSCTQR